MSGQQQLFRKPRAEKPSLKSVSASHDENNLRCAKEILECPEKWGGEESGLVKWARAVVARLASGTVSRENGFRHGN